MPPAVGAAQVRYGPVGAGPADPVVDRWIAGGRIRVLADRRCALLEVDGIGRFLIEDSVTITVERAPDAGSDQVSNVLYGPAAGLALAQRGEFALHASTVEVGRSGVAITGASGSGKSTTALALDRRGHRLGADDVSPVRLRAAGGRTRTASVLPFGRPVHVWPETATALGLDVTAARAVGAGRVKLSLPAPPSGPPVPLHAIVALRPDDTATAVEAAVLPTAAAITELRASTYLARLAAGLWRAELFAWVIALTRCLPVWLVTRPTACWSVDLVADQVEEIAARPVADGRRS